MPQDVLIIGGGIIGVSTAYVLARAGARVTLVESGDLCEGSSYGNAGLICPCHSTPIPGPGVLWQGVRWMLNPESPFYIRPRTDPALVDWLWQFRRFCNEAAVDSAIPHLRDLQRASLALYEAWIQDIETDVHFEKKGGLELFLTRRKFEKAAAEVDHMRSFGLHMELLDRDSVLALEPAAHPDIVGGVHYQEDAHIDPNRFVRALAETAARNGAAFCLREPVVRLVREGRIIRAVETRKQTIPADRIVVAAGAWSPSILETAGVRLKMQPAKGYSITMRAPRNGPRVPLHLAEARMAVTPIGDHLRFAGTLELSGLDTRINPRRVNAIRRGGLSYLAMDTQPDELEVWAGLRPVSPDGLPYIGRHPEITNLHLATGHAMLGVSMGPITGVLTAELLLGENLSHDIRPFRLDRF